LLAAIAAAIVIGRHVDRHALFAALRAAQPAWLALATALGVIRIASRAIIWRVSLHVEPPVPLGRLVRYTMAAVSASLVTPARAGEALRLWLLRQEHGVPLRVSIGVALGEKVLDGLALLVLVLPLPWLVPVLPGWVAHTIEVLALVTVPGLAIGWWIARRRVDAGRIGLFFAQIRILREPGTLALAFLVCLGGWCLDLLALHATMRAVGLHQGLGPATFVLLVVNVALLVPSTPGNLGTLEAAAVVAMQVLHVERPQAVAVAILYHAAQIGPLVVFAIFHPRLMIGARSKQLAELSRRAVDEPLAPQPH
jgi:uncharacterized membrane protein YbhN (UPF0104 family)